MELTIYQYSFLLFGLFSLALGLTMLVCWPTGSFKLSKYRDSKIMFGVTFTAISVGNCFRMYNSAFGETPQVYADFLSPYVISLILMFIILFGYSILALYRSEHIGIRTALADVGIAMGQGTAVAKEVADITLSDGDLSSIVQLVKLSRVLSHRMDRSFAQVIGLNTAFMAAGVTGLVTPQTSSLLHNVTTIALGLDASQPVVGVIVHGGVAQDGLEVLLGCVQVA